MYVLIIMFSRKFSGNGVKRIHILRDFSIHLAQLPSRKLIPVNFLTVLYQIAHFIAPVPALNFTLKKINKLKEEYHSCLLQEVFMSALNLNKDDPQMFCNSVESRWLGPMRRGAVLSSCRCSVCTGLGPVPDVHATEISFSRASLPTSVVFALCASSLLSCSSWKRQSNNKRQSSRVV